MDRAVELGAERVSKLPVGDSLCRERLDRLQVQPVDLGADLLGGELEVGGERREHHRVARLQVQIGVPMFNHLAV